MIYKDAESRYYYLKEGQKMNEAEKIIVQIGEFVSTEMDEVNRIEYTKDKEKLTAFTVHMENGKRYTVHIKEA